MKILGLLLFVLLAVNACTKKQTGEDPASSEGTTSAATENASAVPSDEMARKDDKKDVAAPPAEEAPASPAPVAVPAGGSGN